MSNFTFCASQCDITKLSKVAKINYVTLLLKFRLGIFLKNRLSYTTIIRAIRQDGYQIVDDSFSAVFVCYWPRMEVSCPVRQIEGPISNRSNDVTKQSNKSLLKTHTNISVVRSSILSTWIARSAISHVRELNQPQECHDGSLFESTEARFRDVLKWEISYAD